MRKNLHGRILKGKSKEQYLGIVHFFIFLESPKYCT